MAAPPTPVSNPPNPWQSTHVDYLGEPPSAELEVYEEHAKEIIAENDSPDVGFRYSVNPYRGCFHACAYCLVGETRILMADGRHRALSTLQVGDEIYGTVQRGAYRRYVKTQVLAHWSTCKAAYRVRLTDGTELIASGDHRFLTNRGWKYVTGTEQGDARRPHLTASNVMIGTGRFAASPEENADYRRGYLCGMIRGDALLASYQYERTGRAHGDQHQFRLALVDLEALQRTRRYLADLEVATQRIVFQEPIGARRRMFAVRTHARVGVARIRELVGWPTCPSSDWRKGFLAGIFDAEGSCSAGVVRIANTDDRIISHTLEALRAFSFDCVRETRTRTPPVQYVRIRGGAAETLRFFHTTDPAITRKRDIAGRAVKHPAVLGVASVEPLGVELPMYDLTTGTGDFIAEGVVSHNCYARPSHQYLGFGAGSDFDRKIVVKVNAPEALRRAFERRSWRGDHLMFSGNVDCYQPLEASYAITRGCLEVCRDYRNPVGIVTKGTLVRRDLDVLAELARTSRVRVYVSIPFADAETARLVEPGAPAPSQRFETLRMCTQAGVPCGVSVSPIIPGLNDADIPEILERARAAGARSAFHVMLRLPAEVLPVFDERMEAALPLRIQKIRNAVKELRGGKMNEAKFGARMVGRGPRWAAIEALFELHCRRLGLNAGDNVGDEDDWKTTFRRPKGQGELFG